MNTIGAYLLESVKRLLYSIIIKISVSLLVSAIIIIGSCGLVYRWTCALIELKNNRRTTISTCAYTTTVK